MTGHPLDEFSVQQSGARLSVRFCSDVYGPHASLLSTYPLPLGVPALLRLFCPLPGDLPCAPLALQPPPSLLWP